MNINNVKMISDFQEQLQIFFQAMKNYWIVLLTLNICLLLKLLSSIQTIQVSVNTTIFNVINTNMHEAVIQKKFKECINNQVIVKAFKFVRMRSRIVNFTGDDISQLITILMMHCTKRLYLSSHS